MTLLDHEYGPHAEQPTKATRMSKDEEPARTYGLRGTIPISTSFICLRSTEALLRA